MSKKPKQSPEDSIAEEFVFGGNKPQTGAAPTPDVELEPEAEAEAECTSFTVDLRESVHRKLSALAAKTGKSKADIVRMLLDNALEDLPE